MISLKILSRPAAFIIGLILCAAGFSKLLNFDAFNNSLNQIFPNWLASLHISIYIPSIEIVAGINLLRFDITIGIKILLAFLLISFLTVTFDLEFVNTVHACGCFYGQFTSLFGTSSGPAFARALVLSAISIPVLMAGTKV